MDEICRKALTLLAARDYTTAELAAKLRARFNEDPTAVIEELKRQGLIDDLRFARNFVERRAAVSPLRLREELTRRGVPVDIIEAALGETRENRPSLRAVVEATMINRKLTAPLSRRDAARLFRALSRLGYPDDDIREELERFHEQQ